MSKNEWILVLTLLPLALVAGALVVYVLRISRATELAKNVTWTFEVPVGKRIPMAPGVWTVSPGQRTIRWTGEMQYAEVDASDERQEERL